MAYERFSPHRQLNLTNEDMDKKVKNHMLSLKDSRSRDLQKWISQIQNQIESKITLSKLNSLIDMAKQTKYEVPQTIRDQIERATKFGRQLKKWCQNKHPLEKLKQKKEQLEQQKIITNEMSNFEQAVSRSEQWSQKAESFQFDYFNEGQLRNPTQRIDFRMLHSIVQDYVSLPILDNSFEATVKRLHDETQAILERIPQITKVAKTRTSVPSKVSLAVIKKLLDDIDKHTVIHDDFEFFKEYVNESLELIERISMFFQDERCQKTTKTMIGYQKLLNDIPIITSLPARLEKYMEYSQIIDKIKKDIINPNRFEQTQELIAEANRRGFCSAELYEYESKLKVYRGWFQSTQILNVAESQRRLVDIIKEQRPIIANMIDEGVFKAQLHYARTQLNIEPGNLQEYEKRFEQIDRRKQEIRLLLSKEQPDLQTMVDTLLNCIKQAIRYPEFISLYMRIDQIVTILVKIEYLLEMYRFSETCVTFLKKHEYDELINVVSSKRQMKEMTKSEAEKMLEEVRRPFPKMLQEWTNFQKFLGMSQAWQDRAQNFLEDYSKNGDLDDLTLDQLLVASENVLTNKKVLEHLTEVHLIVKWKGILEEKLNSRQTSFFTESQRVEMEILITNLQSAELKADLNDIKAHSLRFLHTNRFRIRQLIHCISQCPIERTQKLPDLIRTSKDIERLNIRDQELLSLKDQLSLEIGNCEIWKQRYLGLKKYELAKKQQDNDDEKKKHFFKNPQFIYYFKLPILINEFYQGTKLRIPLDQLNKMKVQFEEVGEYMKKFEVIHQTDMPTFKQVQELESQGNKINLFFIENWVMKKRGRYVYAWKTMAQTIIETMPILRLEQLEIPKNIDFIEQITVVPPQPIGEPVEPTVKRQRKQNTHYNNDEITLLTEDIFPKMKKARPNADPERRARMKDKKIMKDYAKYIKQPVVYCICRMGLMNQTSIMVCCQSCQIWFHTECLGLKKGIMKNIPKFFCYACAQRTGKQFDYFNSFFWWSRQKLTELEFQSIMKEGRQLGVKIEELAKLQVIEERIKKWQNAANRILEDINRESIDKNQRRELHEIYLESFWLPTRNFETDALRELSKTFQDFKKSQRSA